jgi:guanylate kinase
MRGILFVVSSPSGGGKGTLIRMARERLTNLAVSISWTTRPPRPGELEARDYHFVSIEEFEAMRARGEFLEWARVHGNLYGTARRTVEAELAEGRDIVLEIDIQGAQSVRRAALEAVFIFILPPSFDVLRERLTGRHTESAEALLVRLRNARGEVAHYRDFDYLILNDDAKRAASELVAIVRAERARRARREEMAQQILATFPDPSSIV